MKLPRRFYPFVNTAVLTFMMVVMVTGVATVANLGLASGLLLAWFKTWLLAWPIAWATALLWAPWARKITRCLAEEPGC